MLFSDIIIVIIIVIVISNIKWLFLEKKSIITLQSQYKHFRVQTKLHEIGELETWATYQRTNSL